MIRPRLAASPPAISDQRRALAEAITRHHEAAAAHARLTAATGWSGSAATAVSDARMALEQAEQGLAEAQQAAADHLAGDAPPPAVTVADARRRITEATDALEAAKAARATLEARLPDAANAERTARERVQLAARAVIRAEAAARARALADEVARMQRDLVTKGRELAWLAETGAFPLSETIGYTYGKPADAEIRSTIFRNEVMAQRWPDFPAPDGSAPWRDALAALQADAGATLP